MDINEILGGAKAFQDKRVGKGQTGETAASRYGKSGATSARGSDTVSLSSDGRLFAQAVKDAQDDSGVRTEKVAELRALVASGNYVPDSHKIAEKLLLSEADFLS